MASSGTLVARFLAALPFELTTAQRRALAVIVADLAGPFPMHRLLQGDVGSGKTVVALAALLGRGPERAPGRADGADRGAGRAARRGGAPDAGRPRRPGGAADQPGQGQGAGRRCWRTWPAATCRSWWARTPCSPRRSTFKSLGMVVIDEQHRFGVEQRATLRAKGDEGDPDLLVMTATPIPRTAAMVIFGDLDLTVLDEMPPGPGGDHHHVAARRRPTSTWPGTGCARRWRPATGPSWSARWSATRPGSRRARPPRSASACRPASWPACGWACCTGRWPRPPGRRPWPSSGAGEIEVLVATTVIEVGVDVPEATVMVIESADRFGIAQLHQLRGRVGRGALPSWCFLLGAGGEDGVAGERLAAVERTTDGFALAEEDLRLRGEGTLLGARQQGQTDLRLASLSDPEDRLLLTEARRVAEAIVEEDPQLEAHEALADEIQLFLSEDEGEYLFKS